MRKKNEALTSPPLPPRVRPQHGAYHYDLGRDENGRRRWRKLSRIDEGEHELYKALAKLKQPTAETLGDAFNTFIGSADFARLAPRTQTDYLFYMNGADGTGQLRRIFQDAHPDGVTPGEIAQYLYHREKEGAAASGNKEIACLSSVYNHIMRIGQYEGANPCKGVRRNKTSARTRYPDDDEFEATFLKAPPAFQDLMMGLYLTGLRQADLKRARKDQVAERGGRKVLRLQESKRGKLIEIEITDALAEVIERASARSPDSPFIWTNSRGEPWTHDAIQSASMRLKQQEQRDWTLHDIRAKAESDSEFGLGLLSLYRRARRIRAVK